MTWNWSEVLNILFSYGGWVLGLVLSYFEIKEARQSNVKSDILLEEIRKLKAQNVMLQLKFDMETDDEVSEKEYHSLGKQIMDIADTSGGNYYG
jgi:hypothetical protein